MKNIQPAIVIGLGGTGVKTITYLKKNLVEQAPDVAQFVRFLAIDIDELKGEAPSAGLFGEPIRLDPEKNEFYRIVDQTRGAEAKNIPAVSSWFPEDAYKFLPLAEGARQAKPVGRLGFFLHHGELARRLHQLTDRIVTPEIRTRFPGLRAGELNIYIVSSICGGTGGGLFLDVAYELRYLQEQRELPEKSRIKGLFALGDVYDAISKRVLANTYASLRELNWVQRERASFHPVYPDGTRDVIHTRAFDAIYLFGSSNNSNIEFASPDDFAQLCAEFIFLDSGADAQENGDALSAMIQSTRNNAEVYTMTYDADDTPRCFSSLGLCKIRFPAQRVGELCAVRMAREIIEHHIVGRLSEAEIIEARKKAQEFLITEGLGCDDENSDLPDRLVEKQLDGRERLPLGSWVTQNLARAYNNDLENMRDLEIGRINQIVKTLTDELNQMQNDMPLRVIEAIRAFHDVLELAITGMFRDNLGVSFVARFLQELLDKARSSRDFAQQEMKNLLGHEKRLADQMNNHTREMAGLLERGIFSFLRGEARRAQLKETYTAIRQHFINRINIMKIRAAVSFYDGVHDTRQRLMEGGEGAISRLSQKVNDIELIQAFVANLAKNFQEVYDDNKKMKASPFEVLIYDNDRFSELHEIFDAVYTDALRARLFEVILTHIGGSIWDLRHYIDNPLATEDLRALFLLTCQPPFQEQIDRKTVAQRIHTARQSLNNPKDYGPNLRSGYELANYFCRLNDAVARFANLRHSEQGLACVVAYLDDEDRGWYEVRRTLRESMTQSGREVPFTHTSDRHSILIYREFCGFPAYTLSRIGAYYNNFMNEARSDNAPPLQMLTKDPLPFINVPTRAVLSKFDVMAVEALALGVLISDSEQYYMVTRDEWRRRKLAEEAHSRGLPAAFDDRTAGSNRRMGSTLHEVMGRLDEQLPDEARLASQHVTYQDTLAQQIAERRAGLESELLCDLFEALYFEGYQGTARERINLETEIRPAIVFVLKRDFGLEEKHIFRPEQPHQALLRGVYIGVDRDR
jgi:hypothetical protein